MLASGSLLTLRMAPRKELGESFFALFAWVFGIFLVLGSGLALQGALPGPTWRYGFSAIIAFAALHLVAVKGQKSWESPLRYLLVFSTWFFCFEVLTQLFPNQPTNLRIASGLGIFSSSLLLGTTLASMLCGHWYLIDRKLDFAILRRFSKALVASVIFKTLCFLFGFYLVSQGLPEFARAATTIGSLANIALILRFGLSCILASIFSYMIWDCVKRESNQSATGLIYVLLTLVLFGETLSIMLASVAEVIL